MLPDFSSSSDISSNQPPFSSGGFPDEAPSDSAQAVTRINAELRADSDFVARMERIDRHRDDAMREQFAVHQPSPIVQPITNRCVTLNSAACRVGAATRWDITKLDPIYRGSLNQWRPWGGVLHADSREAAQQIAQREGGPGEYHAHLFVEHPKYDMALINRRYAGGRW